jgi:hypothetical protein
MNIYDLYEKGKYDEQGNEHVLCDVIEFDDGQVIAKWRGIVRSLVIHKNLDEFKSISLNDRRTLWKKN